MGKFCEWRSNHGNTHQSSLNPSGNNLSNVLAMQSHEMTASENLRASLTDRLALW